MHLSPRAFSASLSRRIALPLLTCLLPAPLLAAAKSPGAAQPDLIASAPLVDWQVQLKEELQAMIKEALASPKSVGLSVAVALEDHFLIDGGFGLADLENELAVQSDTLFRVGSVTKQFTSAAIMRLVEKGKLDLDAELHDFLPSYPEIEHPVSLRQLLTHTSGIHSYTSLPEWAGTTVLRMEHADMLKFINKAPFDFEPDARFSYNNSGYYILGMVLEHSSAETYAQYLARDLFKPLGLERTRVGSRTAIIKNRAQGYSLQDDTFVNDNPISMTHPFAAGNILSTAHELVLWQQALTRGDVVDLGTYEQMTTRHTLSNGSRTSYGFGLGLATLQDMELIQHSGGIDGFNSVLIWLPDLDLSVAVLSNSEAFSAPTFGNEIAEQAVTFILEQESGY